MESRPSKPGEHDTQSWNEDDDSDSSLTKKARSISPYGTGQEVSAPAQGKVFAEGVDKKSDKTKNSSQFGLFETTEKTAQPEKEPERESKVEITESAETEPENLTSEEITAVVQEYVHGRSEAVDAEIEHAETEGQSETIAVANKRLLEHIDSKLTNNPAEHVDTLLDDALLDTAQELGLPGAETAVENDISTEPASSENMAEAMPTPEINPSAVEDAEDSVSTASSVFANTTNGTPTASGGNPASSTPTATAPHTAHSTTNPNSSTSPTAHDGSAGVPPAARYNASGSGGGNFANDHFNANATPASNTIRQKEAAPSPNRSKHDFADGVLIGGITGYLIGRHRGRIKTEKKFMPIAEKLQKEVTELQNKVVQKEQQVRKMAAQKVIAEQPVAANRHVEQSLENVNVESAMTSAVHAERPEQAELPQEPVRTSFKETARPEQPLHIQKARRDEAQPPAYARIEHMPKDKLLEAAAEVIVDGSTLKKIFEAGAINESALRKVMTEYNRGGRSQAERQLHIELALQAPAHHEATAITTPDKNNNAHSSKAVGETDAHKIETWEYNTRLTTESPEKRQAQATADEYTRQKISLPPKRTGRIGPLTSVAVIIIAALIIWFLISH